MYSMSKGTYACDTCGFEEKQGAPSGDIWECEYCGAHFCTACFVKEAGREAFDQMLRETDRVLCAKHYKEGVFDK